MPTTVMGVRRSSVFVRVSVTPSVCVCLHNRNNTAETTITKLATGIVHHESWLSMGQKAKGQGHRITKFKNVLKVIEWLA